MWFLYSLFLYSTTKIKFPSAMLFKLNLLLFHSECKLAKTLSIFYLHSTFLWHIWTWIVAPLFLITFLWFNAVSPISVASPPSADAPPSSVQPSAASPISAAAPPSTESQFWIFLNQYESRECFIHVFK